MLEKPVTFPPGRARLCTKPVPIGSATATMTIGMVDVARFAAKAQGVKVAQDTAMVFRFNVRFGS
jgi:hypothetical protein